MSVKDNGFTLRQNDATESFDLYMEVEIRWLFVMMAAMYDAGFEDGAMGERRRHVDIPEWRQTMAALFGMPATVAMTGRSADWLPGTRSEDA